MPRIVFGKGSWPSLDEADLDGAIPASAIDAYQDELGVWHKRPGKTRLGTSSIPTPVQGIYWSETFQTFFAVGAGRIFKVSPAGVITEMLGATVATTAPATFSETTLHVYVATGGRLAKTDGVTSVLETDISVSGINVTHLAWMDDHLLVNEAGTNRFGWTDAGTEDFGAGNFAEASADRDNIAAIGVGWRELLLAGTRSTEIWYNAGGTPNTFQRLEGAFIERGISAPYSLVKADNTWFWLDHERSFIRLEGRSPKVLSSPVHTQLRALTSVADLVVSAFQVDRRRFFLFSSVAMGLSYVYDYVLDSWYQWGLWNGETAEYAKWPIHSFGYSSINNQYIALGDDGWLWTVEGDASDARFLLRSSHMSFESYELKPLNEIAIRCKRGYVADSSSPVFTVRWRDESGPWSNEVQVPLNKKGEYNPVARLFRLGQFRTRQFEFVQTDVAPFSIAGVEAIL